MNPFYTIYTFLKKRTKKKCNIYNKSHRLLWSRAAKIYSMRVRKTGSLGNTLPSRHGHTP
uniref:Uncharacterized protein n=1 Tax=Anguilla anguilla TaxID=7936 RepID=A0A0E9W4X7_ANGAN